MVGRCDDVEWRQTAGGLCAKTYAPKNIRWVFDLDKLQDVDKLPEEKKKEITSNGEKLQVYIPWSQQGTFYVPQCSRAYFMVKDKDGVEQPVSASYLFVDKGLNCQRVEHDSTEYHVTYRPKGTRNKFDFATESNPKCDA